MRVKISDAPGYVKDKQSVISTDREALDVYRRRRNREAEVTEGLSDINSLKQEVHDLKRLIYLVLEKVS